jgi:hypothetical protein
MRAWHVLIVVVLLCGVLEFQVFSQNKRFDTLRQTVQGLSAVISVGKGLGSSDDVARLRDDLQKLTAQVERIPVRLADGSTPIPPPNLGKSVDPELQQLFSDRVLSVVHNEVNRVRDVQLQRNRDALVKYRRAAIREFAIKQGLTAGQEAAIQTILEDEVDKMVELLKDVNWENPSPAFLTQWSAALAQTNDKVQDILNADQMSIFLYLRHLEQQAMQGWLPKSL